MRAGILGRLANNKGLLAPGKLLGEQQEMQTENKIFVEKKLKICKICILTQTP